MAREYPLEKGMDTHSSILGLPLWLDTHSSILAWRIPWTDCIVHGVAESDTTERLSLSKISMLQKYLVVS